jgi:hypothetical protein
MVAMLSFYGCSGQGASGVGGAFVPASRPFAALGSLSAPQVWEISGSYHGRYTFADPSGPQAGYVVFWLKQNGSVISGTCDPRAHGKKQRLKLSGTVTSEGHLTATLAFTIYAQNVNIYITANIMRDRMSGVGIASPPSGSGLGIVTFHTRKRKAH